MRPYIHLHLSILVVISILVMHLIQTHEARAQTKQECDRKFTACMSECNKASGVPVENLPVCKGVCEKHYKSCLDPILPDRRR